MSSECLVTTLFRSSGKVKLTLLMTLDKMSPHDREKDASKVKDETLYFRLAIIMPKAS